MGCRTSTSLFDRARLAAKTASTQASRPSVRLFHHSNTRFEASPHALPTRKPVGAFRGGLIGFLLGTSIGAYGSYYFLFDGYTRSNDLLAEDMYALQAAVTRLHNYCSTLEAKIDALGKKR